ncbi:hypothetical protein [Litorimonas cladophorae]|uniref:hypothetical protein n=1 Tax=Litorimonas cladophorae TaxID=1220491 RepID=UPI00167B678A|nr:hypothetical protein [Litorimonas cladophorae]
MSNSPGFFALAALAGYSIVICISCLTIVSGFFGVLIQFPEVLKHFLGLIAITSIIVCGIFLWLRKCDARGRLGRGMETPRN